MKFRTWDSHGNAETVHSQTIKVDAAAPTAQITSPARWRRRLGDVTVNVDARDTGSGDR